MDNIYKAVQLTIDSQNLALSKTPTHVYIANQYVDTNDTPLITAPFIIQKALENGTGVVDIVSSTIGSIYEVRLLCEGEMLISGYFYMPPMNAKFSELELYTSYPPRTPPVVNEFWQQTEQYILEKTNTLLNFVQVFNSVASIRLLVGNLEDLLVVNNRSSLVGAVNQLKLIIDEINKNIGDKTTLSTQQKATVVGAINEINSLIINHATDYKNPHKVTKAQLGLDKVDNTADLDKPISNATLAKLDLKSNKTDVYTKDEVNNRISTLSATTYGGHKGYLTFADADAAKNTLTANTVVEVTNDSDAAKNGIYIWDGSELKKSNYDPITVSKNYVNSNVKSLVGLRSGINIADLSKRVDGYFINYAGGTLSPASWMSTLGAYEIKPSTEYQTNVEYYQQFAFYDAAMNYISGQENPGESRKFTTPANAKYVKFSVLTDDVPKFIVTESSVFPATYTPYVEYKDDLRVEGSQIDNATVDAESVNNLIPFVEQGLDIYSLNIIDPSKIVNDYYVPYASGEIIPLNGTVAAGFYDIKPNTRYRTSSFYNQQFAFFDKDKKYISGLASPDNNNEFTTPSNAKFIRLTVADYDINRLVIAESAVFPDTYVNYTKKLMPTVEDSLGIYPLNIVDPNKAINGYYVPYGSGGLVEVSWMSALGPFIVKPNTEYQVSDYYNQQFAFYDKDLNYISGLPNPDVNHKFVTPSNAKYIKFSILPSDIANFVVAESKVFPSEYKPNTAKILKDIELPNANKVTTIIVSADTTDTTAQFKGKNAIQEAIDSITDASATNRYKILVKAGLYKITKANEFIGNPGYPAMICPKDYVDIVGQGADKTIVWAELPYDDSQIGASIDGNTYDRYKYQTIYNFAGNMTIEDITFVAVNLRYTLHQDSPIGANKSRHYKNVNLLFKGNKGALKPFGLGTYEGEQTYVFGGYSESDTSMAFSCHNNSKFNTPSLWHFENHCFISLGSNIVIQPQNLGSLVNDKIELVGCSFGGQGYIINYFDQWGTAKDDGDHFNHAEWQIVGHGNDPFLFTNNSDGYSLRIKSTAVGVGNQVRFDVNSSAYPLLVKDKRRNTDVNLYIDSLEYIDGYIVKDGSAGLVAQAIGAIDISEKVYENDAGVNYTSLAKRLGNLSSGRKTLTVLVNGVANNVVFNKNYSNMTNAQIIADINAQLTNATADVYSYGRDYYPMMTDVAEYAYNNGSTFIAKGSVVTKQGGFVKLAQANDKVFGVALDDIPVMTTDSQGFKRGNGRVLKRGYISADKSKAHFVLADNQNPSIGTRFAVSNGQLVTDASGKISVDIDAGVVSINC